MLYVLSLIDCTSQEETPVNHWEVYRGDKAALQYASLDQIHTENVNQLEVAWTYETGGQSQRSTIQCNPIIIQDRMYITSPDLRVIALEAGSGNELWQFDPEQENIMGGVNRGVSYWTDGKEERILFTGRHFLYALDALSGKQIPSFGTEGRVDMRQDLGLPPEEITMSVTSPGIIYKDLIILGSAVGEGYNSSPGHIRAYDVKTGEISLGFSYHPPRGRIWIRRLGPSARRIFWRGQCLGRPKFG